MNTRVVMHCHSHRQGITLLEVLVSIGILAVGLIASLALIPAGQVFLKRAEVDEQSAVMIPNAIATIETMNLFRLSGLEWQVVDGGIFSDADGAGIVQQQPYHLPNNPDRWVYDITNFTSETIDSHWALEKGPSLSATTPQPDRPVRVFLNTDPPVAAGDSGGDGTWTFDDWTTAPLPPLGVVPDRKMANKEPDPGNGIKPGTIDESTRSESHIFRAEYLHELESGDTEWRPLTLTVTRESDNASGGNTDPADFEQYSMRRNEATRNGPAELILGVHNDTRANETISAAGTVVLPTLGDNGVRPIGSSGQLKVRMVRSGSVDVTGRLWRFLAGARGGNYQATVQYPDENGAPPATLLGVPLFPPSDPASLPGDGWVRVGGIVDPNFVPDYANTADRSYFEEDTDWFALPVFAGQTIQFNWAATDGQVRSESLEANPFRLRHDPVGLLAPYSQTPVSASYSIPRDGVAYIKAALRAPTDVSNSYAADIPDRLNTFSNPAYKLDIEAFKNDRMIAIDPLMCTHLDRLIGSGAVTENDINSHPLVSKRRRFADFQQNRVIVDGTTIDRAFVIPRLNWAQIANKPFNDAIAIAERLCRYDDNPVLVFPDSDPDADPQGVEFVERRDDGIDNDGDGMVDEPDERPLRPKLDGLSTWMLTLQPTDPGPVAFNWMPGKWFDVDVVVFRDRMIPSSQNLSAPTNQVAEYAFEGEWGIDNGLLRVVVSQPSDPAVAPLDDDTVGDLFRTGQWLLLAARTAYDEQPIESTQRLEWLQIASAEVGRMPNDPQTFYADVLLNREPASDTLQEAANTGRLARPGKLPVVVMAYQGVVAVNRYQLQLKP